MRSQIESGAELIARLNNKLSLHGLLEDGLSVEGPRSTDVIEIAGEPMTGKSLLLSKMLAKCILPTHYRTTLINGCCNALAILINTDHHFQVSKLIDLMVDILNSAFQATQQTDVDRTALARTYLRNLRVINCYNSEQFDLTLRTLDDLFLVNGNISLLAIDSITAYYWQDREHTGPVTIDSYVKKLLKLTKDQTTRFNVATIYTRQHDGISNTHKKKTFSKVLGGDRVDYKLHLAKMRDDSPKHVCTLDTGGRQQQQQQPVKKIYYSILSSGIEWEMDEKEGRIN